METRSAGAANDSPGRFAPQLGACPLCGSRAIPRYHHIPHPAYPFEVSRCDACGFIFMNPPFNEQVQKGFYSEDYFVGNAAFAYVDERREMAFASQVWRRRLDVIRRYADGGNFLDVGAAFGGLLQCARNFYTPYGIERSPYAAAYARTQFGDAIHEGTLEDNPFPAGFFSAITMIELIEHLPDPARAVGECLRLLRPGGVLVVQTANMAGMQAKLLGERYGYYLPGHLSYFTARNLTGLLKREGFRDVKVYYPVEFGLLPKLLKSRGGFTSIADYRAWLRIALYHWAGMVHCGDFALMSSMAVYAVK